MFSPYRLGLNFWNTKGKTVLNAFIEVVNESNRKQNKLCVDQGRVFFLQNDMHNEQNLK